MHTQHPQSAKLRSKVTLFAIALSAFAFALASPLAAHEDKPAAAQAPEAKAMPSMPSIPSMDSPEMQAMMKAMMPGEKHKHLGRMVGDWTTAMKLWMAPEAPPIENSGKMSAKWILGGRYVETVYTGDFMGQPFEGHGTDAYDNLAEQFVGTWIDTAGTGILVVTGQCDDAACKSVTMRGEMIDPMSGQKLKTRQVTTWVDADHYQLEMFSADASGRETKNMEMHAKRVR